MTFIDNLARACLLCTNEIVIILFFILGYFSEKRAAFCRALFILLFTLIFNPYLKSLWLIPLDPGVGKEGYAFPSGHMQTALAFWGWLAFELYTPWVFAVIAVLLVSVGLSLRHFGYHNAYDIGGALFFGLMTLIGYYFLCRSFKQKNNAVIGFILSIIALPFIILTPGPLPGVWLAEGALIGISIGYFFTTKFSESKEKLKESMINKILKITSVLIGVMVVYGIFGYYLKPYMNLQTLNFIQFFIVGLWIGSFPVLFMIFRNAFRRCKIGC